MCWVEEHRILASTRMRLRTANEVFANSRVNCLRRDTHFGEEITEIDIWQICVRNLCVHIFDIVLIKYIIENYINQYAMWYILKYVISANCLSNISRV